MGKIVIFLFTLTFFGQFAAAVGESDEMAACIVGLGGRLLNEGQLVIGPSLSPSDIAKVNLVSRKLLIREVLGYDRIRERTYTIVRAAEIYGNTKDIERNRYKAKGIEENSSVFLIPTIRKGVEIAGQLSASDGYRTLQTLVNSKSLFQNYAQGDVVGKVIHFIGDGLSHNHDLENLGSVVVLAYQTVESSRYHSYNIGQLNRKSLEWLIVPVQQTSHGVLSLNYMSRRWVSVASVEDSIYLPDVAILELGQVDYKSLKGPQSAKFLRPATQVSRLPEGSHEEAQVILNEPASLSTEIPRLNDVIMLIDSGLSSVNQQVPMIVMSEPRRTTLGELLIDVRPAEFFSRTRQGWRGIYNEDSRTINLRERGLTYFKIGHASEMVSFDIFPVERTQPQQEQTRRQQQRREERSAAGTP